MVLSNSSWIIHSWPTEEKEICRGYSHNGGGENTTLVDSAFVAPDEISDSDGICYNYAGVLCHYGSLVIEFRDGWGVGHRERMVRCWRLFMPHFQTAGRTKYTLAALNILFWTNAPLWVCAHQVMWHRFVNSMGGMGNNISCHLYNEHINKQIKYIIQNMGPNGNLTEASLQRAARSVSTLHCICTAFDKQTGVPHGTVAHSTRSDTQDIDVLKVVSTVLSNRLLIPTPGRKHVVLSQSFIWTLCINGMYQKRSAG